MRARALGFRRQFLLALSAAAWRRTYGKICVFPGDVAQESWCLGRSVFAKVAFPETSFSIAPQLPMCAIYELQNFAGFFRRGLNGLRQRHDPAFHDAPEIS